jgi:LCP family protein required for cell wall assembly
VTPRAHPEPGEPTPASADTAADAAAGPPDVATPTAPDTKATRTAEDAPSTPATPAAPTAPGKRATPAAENTAEATPATSTSTAAEDIPSTLGTSSTPATPPAPGKEAAPGGKAASGTKAAPAVDGTPAADGTPGGEAAATDGRKKRRAVRWLRIAAACTAFLVLSAAGGAWYLYKKLDANITTDTVTENELRVQESQRPTEGPTEAENILLIGSDNRSGSNAAYGDRSDTARSDTTILLHLSADRRSATAVSIPRDLMTHVPQCTRPDGSTVSARFEEFNWAFESGGAACTIRAVEEMTHIRIDHHLVVDFTGFKNIVNAVDGVEVCLAHPVHDHDARLDLPAGRQKLNGEQALGYVRARHGIGDGSDTQRMDRQQDFLASLIKKVRSDGVLLNPVKLYPVLSAATKSLTADPGLDSLSELYGLVQSLQKIPDQSIHFLTAPREQYPPDPNRDQLVQPDADRLFAALHDDRPVNVTGAGTDLPAGPAADGAPGTPSGAPATPPAAGTGDEAGSPSSTPAAGGNHSTDDNADHSTDGGNHSTDSGKNGDVSPGPTYRGTTADRDVCGKDR